MLHFLEPEDKRPEWEKDVWNLDNLGLGQERNLKSEMANLKGMLRQVGKVIGNPKLEKLFVKQDMPKMPEVVFKTYSDEEIRRLNYYIVNMEEQVARALILHQVLGRRISDTLTLQTDCLYQGNGHYIVRISGKDFLCKKKEGLKAFIFKPSVHFLFNHSPHRTR